MSENHVRGSPPGSPFWHHFGTENEKMHEKVVPEEGLGRNRRVKRKKKRKMGSSWEGAHAIRLRLRSRNMVFGFEKKRAECIENDLQNEPSRHLF